MSTSQTPITRAGPLGRLGRWAATHVRVVVAAWAVGIVGLGTLAPHAEQALSGAGWGAGGWESVGARQPVDDTFGGLGGYGLTVAVHPPGAPVPDGVVGAVQRTLRRHPAVATI